MNAVFRTMPELVMRTMLLIDIEFTEFFSKETQPVKLIDHLLDQGIQGHS